MMTFAMNMTSSGRRNLQNEGPVSSGQESGASSPCYEVQSSFLFEADKVYSLVIMIRIWQRLPSLRQVRMVQPLVSSNSASGLR